MGSAGIGSTGHLAGELFAAAILSSRAGAIRVTSE